VAAQGGVDLLLRISGDTALNSWASQLSEVTPEIRSKVRELLKLGTELGTAIRAGMNRNDPWAMARRLAAHTGMTNQWLKDQGLVSVKELWVKTHYPATRLYPSICLI
jgi:hypothetical protein